jgi:type I restriction enzyme M protein
VTDINTDTFDLSARNPNKKEETRVRNPVEILTEIKRLDEESAAILQKVRELL